MSDKAYTHSQIQTIINNIVSAKERLEFLSTSDSRFGELDAYPFGGLTLIPCGRVPQDSNGIAVNSSNALLLQECLSELDSYVECETETNEENNNDDECNNIFSLIEGLNIEVDYERIKTDITTAKNETVLKIDGNGNKIDNLTAIAESSAVKIDDIVTKTDGIGSQLMNISMAIQTVLTGIGEVKESLDELLQCPCDENIINAIQTSLDSLKVDLDNSFGTISRNIDGNSGT